MPRKPGIGPPVIKIERLSDGIDPTIVDDRTGEVLHQPNARAPKVQDAQAERDRMNRAKARKGLELLAKVLPQVVSKPISSTPKLATNQRELGNHVATFPRKPFRRV